MTGLAAGRLGRRDAAHSGPMAMSTPLRRTSALLSAALCAATLLVSGCADDAQTSDGVDYVRVCVDPETRERVPEQRCSDDREYHNHGDSGWFWYYMAMSNMHGQRYYAPPVGQTVNISNYGSFQKPAPTARTVVAESNGGYYERTGHSRTVAGPSDPWPRMPAGNSKVQDPVKPGAKAPAAPAGGGGAKAPAAPAGGSGVKAPAAPAGGGAKAPAAPAGGGAKAPAAPAGGGGGVKAPAAPAAPAGKR